MELMYLSAQAKMLDGCQVRLLDCIAEGLTANEALSRAREFDPDVAVAIMAIEFFDNDVGFLSALRRELDTAAIGMFGHLPSHFSQECLEATGADFVLVGEPDISLRGVLERKDSGLSLAGPGVAVRDYEGNFTAAEFQRIDSLDDLPFADQAAIDHSLYREPFFGQPYTTFQSSRGCPFPCVYCVRTFGRKFVMASAEHVVSEVAAAVDNFGIRYFRFMDDTFTASRKRTLEICAGIRDIGTEVTWSCLTRPNTINGEIAAALRSAGCRRVYVGIESGSQGVIDYLNRGYKLDAVMDNLREVRDSGLEMVGWFIVGSPVENREDFEQSLRLARELNLEYIAVSTLVPYPNTELFERERDDIEFSLFPYSCAFKDQASTDREAEFYRRYYLRPSVMVRKIGSFARHPGESLIAAKEFLYYVAASRRDANRKDLV